MYKVRRVPSQAKTQVNLKEVVAPTADTYNHIWRSPFSIFNVLIPYSLAIGCPVDVQHLPAPFLEDSFTITSPSMLHWQEDANIISPNLPFVAVENQYHSQITKNYSLIQIRFLDFENISPQNLDIVEISKALSTTWYRCWIGLLHQWIGYTFHSIHFPRIFPIYKCRFLTAPLGRLPWIGILYILITFRINTTRLIYSQEAELTRVNFQNEIIMILHKIPNFVIIQATICYEH